MLQKNRGCHVVSLMVEVIDPGRVTDGVMLVCIFTSSKEGGGFGCRIAPC